MTALYIEREKLIDDMKKIDAEISKCDARLKPTYLNLKAKKQARVDEIDSMQVNQPSFIKNPNNCAVCGTSWRADIAECPVCTPPLNEAPKVASVITAPQAEAPKAKTAGRPRASKNADLMGDLPSAPVAPVVPAEPVVNPTARNDEDEDEDEFGLQPEGEGQVL